MFHLSVFTLEPSSARLFCSATYNDKMAVEVLMVLIATPQRISFRGNNSKNLEQESRSFLVFKSSIPAANEYSLRSLFTHRTNLL